MADTAVSYVQINISFGGTYSIYAGNTASDLSPPRYRTHGNLSLQSIATIMRTIATAVEKDDVSVTLNINDPWITV